MTSASTQRSLLLEAVHDAARVAGDIAMRHYRTALAVESKADGSPVTIADREAETAVREWITRRFPQDGIEGEEFGVLRGDARRRWVVDPIDGTKTFIRGVPLWGTLVAVVEDRDVLAGAAYFPAVGEMIAAAPGEGAWWNDARCAVSRVDRIDRATVLTTDARFRTDDAKRRAWQELSKRALVSQTWGDCYGYLLVATGRAEVMVDPRCRCGMRPRSSRSSRKRAACSPTGPARAPRLAEARSRPMPMLAAETRALLR